MSGWRSGSPRWASVALENARLYIEARDANRMKDEFLAVLSHELRTPLNAIVGYARLLRGGILSGEKAARGLETLERNATWLTQIVEDVLDVSKIVAGKIRLDVQPVELSLIVDNAVATVQPAADAKGVRLQTTVDPRVGPVSGDPDRLQQVVWNLMANAVKFTPRDGRVQVRLQRVNSHVEIEVSDTGVGIRPDFLPYVFERFRQGESGTTRKTGGLGLGLAIVRHIIEMHGGTVHAASAGEGQGATFRVRLPLMIVHPEPVVTRREHPRTERRDPLSELADLSGIRVLAIDDERRRTDVASSRPRDCRSRRDHLLLTGDSARADRNGEAGRARRRSWHARDGRLRVHRSHSFVEESRCAGRAGDGPDGVRAVGGSHQGAAKRLRDASGETCRSRGARRIGGDAGAPASRGDLEPYGRRQTCRSASVG